MFDHFLPFIVWIGLYLDFVSREVTVSKEVESTAWPHSNGVHVVAIFPRAGEPAEADVALWDDQLPASVTVVTVVGQSTG